MPIWLSTILEIIKLTIPALIVFLTVYYLLRQYLQGQQQLKAMEIKQQQQSTTLPLRLQAYERLSLFCERIALPNLLLRVRGEGKTAAELRIALMLAIQQEYEHNITQQVYVSEQLWQIIKIARDDSIETVTLVGEKMDPKAPGREFAQALLNIVSQREATGADRALVAVKKEAGILF